MSKNKNKQKKSAAIPAAPVVDANKKEDVVEPEKVENSDLDDTQKVYEMGIGDPGDITYKFKYDNTETDSPYRVLRKYEESGEVLSFKETLKDGTTTEFNGQISLKRTGGGVNGVIEFDMNIALSSAFTITDPIIG